MTINLPKLFEEEKCLEFVPAVSNCHARTTPAVTASAPWPRLPWHTHPDSWYLIGLGTITPKLFRSDLPGVLLMCALNTSPKGL